MEVQEEFSDIAALIMLMVTININNLTLTGGSTMSSSGAIAFENPAGSTLNLNNCTFSNNNALRGGAIYFTEAHKDKRLRCNMKNAQFPGVGVYELPPLTLVYETDIANSIKETTIISSTVAPNITTNNATLTLELESLGNLNITLNNIHGQEVFELYNAFVYEGIFTKSFSIDALPQGMYYIVITHKGNVTVEKIIRK